MLTFFAKTGAAERRRREAERCEFGLSKKIYNYKFGLTGYTKILDTDSCVCYFHSLIWADFTGLSLRKRNG